MVRDRDEVGGKTRKAIGTVKEKIGRVTGSRRLEEQGAAERTYGTVRSGIGKASRKVNEAIDETGRDLDKP